MLGLSCKLNKSPTCVDKTISFVRICYILEDKYQEKAIAIKVKSCISNIPWISWSWNSWSSSVGNIPGNAHKSKLTHQTKKINTTYCHTLNPPYKRPHKELRHVVKGYEILIKSTGKNRMIWNFKRNVGCTSCLKGLGDV